MALRGRNLVRGGRWGLVLGGLLAGGASQGNAAPTKSKKAAIPWGFHDAWGPYSDAAGAAHSTAQQIGMSAAIGARTARISVNWGGIEPSNVGADDLGAQPGWETTD